MRTFKSFITLVGTIGLVAAGTLQAKHMDHHTIDDRTAPVSKVNVEKAVVEAPASTTSSGPRTAETVVNTYCMACHGTGMPGAHKIGDKAAWATVMEAGMDVVLASAINGKNAMPPKGLCGDCSDEELKSAIEFMANFEK